jgi:hypothetical protein
MYVRSLIVLPCLLHFGSAAEPQRPRSGSI